MKTNRSLKTTVVVSGAMLLQAASLKAGSICDALQNSPFKLIHEAYENNNWELYVTSANGKSSSKLTNTPGINELYPQVSPDGTQVCFIVDSGKGRATVRSLWVMNTDGIGRKKIADHARQPCWSPDSETIAFLPQEYPKFNVADYYTKGISFYHLPSGKTTKHVNTKMLHHLYNISYAPNGKWLVATVHAGMGYGHANLLIETNGKKIINLGLRGCRPTFSPDGKHIAWGPGDHELAVVPIDIENDPPKVGQKVFQIFDKQNKIYHVDWSPDGQYLSFSRGPNSKGDLAKPGTYQAACEMVGVFARNWHIYAVKFSKGDVAELSSGGINTFEALIGKTKALGAKIVVNIDLSGMQRSYYAGLSYDKIQNDKPAPEQEGITGIYVDAVPADMGGNTVSLPNLKEGGWYQGPTSKWPPTEDGTWFYYSGDGGISPSGNGKGKSIENALFANYSFRPVAPPLQTTITGLEASALYNVYIHFIAAPWAPGQYGIKAGFPGRDLRLFSDNHNEARNVPLKTLGNWTRLTNSSESNKESDWFLPPTAE